MNVLWWQTGIFVCFVTSQCVSSVLHHWQIFLKLDPNMFILTVSSSWCYLEFPYLKQEKQNLPHLLIPTQLVPSCISGCLSSLSHLLIFMGTLLRSSKTKYLAVRWHSRPIILNRRGTKNINCIISHHILQFVVFPGLFQYLQSVWNVLKLTF